MATSGNIPAAIFKAYDIRGIVDETLTTDIVFDIGRAFATEAKSRDQHIVVIGRDGRLSGPKLIDALINGLRTSGVDVIDIGMAPTPVIYFAAQHIGTGSCIALTGSHNPPNYNGLKMVIGGVTLSGDTIQKLKHRIESNDFAEGEGQLDTKDVIPQYINRIVSDIKLNRPMKVVIDCGNGVAGAVAPELLNKLGCETIELFCDVDGNFPNHHPDPSKPENLKDLVQAVKESGADIGLAFDGDGDRLGVVTPDGDIIWPDRQMMLYAKDVLQRNPGAQIIYDIKCTTNLAKVIKENGGEPLMWVTGHSLIKAKLKETGAPLAGEMSGHIFFKERWYGFDDGTYTAARLLEILAKDSRSTQEIFSSLPDSVNTPELNILMEEGENFQFVKDLVNGADIDNAKITTIDGLRVDYDDGFGLVRASNTTPSLVIRFEAKDQAGIVRIQEEFRTLMLKINPDLQLPF
ncbi:MAG: phosphomannomutase/phosphoglucomutase [Gammaproteobacteria bacterium]|nr:phosphomannomutase/phosphoglucomutase [Gammaproteobacteria bacterium]